MQIFEKYKSDYEDAMTKFKIVREEYIQALKTIRNLRVIPSQANYVMCEVLGDCTAKELTEILLDKYSLFIKDLSSKDGIDGEYIRLAVKRPHENKRLLEALKDIMYSL